MENEIQNTRFMGRLFLSAIPVFLLLGAAMHAFAGLPPSMIWVPIATTLAGVTAALGGTILMVFHLRHLENMLRAAKARPTPKAQRTGTPAADDAADTKGISMLECLLCCAILGGILIGSLMAYHRTIAEVVRNDIAMTSHPTFVVVEDAPAHYPHIDAHTIAYATLHDGSAVVCSLDPDQSGIWRISGTLGMNGALKVRSLLPTQTLVDFCARATQQ